MVGRLLTADEPHGDVTASIGAYVASELFMLLVTCPIRLSEKHSLGKVSVSLLLLLRVLKA